MGQLGPLQATGQVGSDWLQYSFKSSSPAQLVERREAAAHDAISVHEGASLATEPHSAPAGINGFDVSTRYSLLDCFESLELLHLLK